MADNDAERRVVIDWFKNDFSREAGMTTHTGKLPDGRLSYSFSVINNSGMNFDKFKFKVKAIDKDNGKEIGAATINAGVWTIGDKKNFKSKFSLPDNVNNISFVMFAESIEYEVRHADNTTKIAGAVPAPKPVTTFSKVNSGAVTSHSFAQKKNEKKLNKMRLGKSKWITATMVLGIICALGAVSDLTSGAASDAIETGIIAAVFLGIFAYLKYSLGNKAKRIRMYETRVNRKGNTSLDELAASAGRPLEKVSDEIHQMIADGFFPGAYVDFENRLLVMTENGQPIEDVDRSVAMNRKAKRKAARKEGVVPESLDDLITMTDDSEIKDKLNVLRAITRKIDSRAEEVPDLGIQVADFREKFYPEVVRLTDEYNEKIVDMGKFAEENVKPEIFESAEGAPVINANPNYLQEQAAEIKSQLISLIDSITEASENLLEKLHEDDIMDITTDIKMLQTTLASKGLLDSDFDIK